ncbi:hypothetical protein KIN20_006547 [Parelaphostrongylus tenuis]|uniref:Uncharacterized protein n=1 Tax=Parelaphostrongylus tenuis TaxID=148309 RepID=A0AAD5MMR3_PARTN|nr:hypothetical protein KIN20_006547 [Parelaphostrongylus tenuis]
MRRRGAACVSTPVFDGKPYIFKQVTFRQSRLLESLERPDCNFQNATLCQAVVEELLHSDLTDSYEPLAKVPVIAVKAVILEPMIFRDDLSWFHNYNEDENELEEQSPV